MRRPTALLSRTVAVALLVTGLQAPGQPSQPPQPRNANAKTVARDSSTSDAEQGQQVFARNCSRCHKAPESIPSSISGTVALHMRIRAGLSEQDYKRLVAFLNQ
jgi:cytochrome c5